MRNLGLEISPLFVRRNDVNALGVPSRSCRVAAEGHPSDPVKRHSSTHSPLLLYSIIVARERTAAGGREGKILEKSEKNRKSLPKLLDECLSA